MVRKVKKQRKVRLSYKERYKHQALTIRQLYGEVAQAENVSFHVREENMVLKGEVEDLTAKCGQLEKQLATCEEIKRMYLNALNTKINEEDRNKKPWWKKVGRRG